MLPMMVPGQNVYSWLNLLFKYDVSVFGERVGPSNTDIWLTLAHREGGDKSFDCVSIKYMNDPIFTRFQYYCLLKATILHF